MEIGSEDTRVGMATFSDDVNIEFHLGTYLSKEDILQALELVQFRYEYVYSYLRTRFNA